MKENILKLVKDGFTYNEITKILNCSKSTISYHCSKNNVISKNLRTKTTDELIIKIRELYEIHESCIKVANLLRISKQVVLKNIKVVNNRLTEDELRENRIKSVIDWRKRTKQKLVDYKGGKCEICEYNRSVSGLEFHHIDPSKKDFQVCGKSWSFERLKNEADKCMLVCSNCHREIHEKIEKNKISKTNI